MDALAQLSTALAGRYTIDREVGAGGMATVYLARDVRHDRNVALKVLNPELGAVLGVERFLSEIKVTANLQHPNLLPLFDSGEAEGLLFYVMPYVEGESLRARLTREKQLPIEEAVRIATAVASALDYAHRHGVIHRDLKPENILLHEGQPLIADFGIALAVSKAGGSRITQTGLSLGTPQYMSPEQATGDRVIDARTDIYSLGAVLYEMLAGEPPHTGTTAQAIIARLLTEKPRALRASRETVPAYVDAAIERALAKLPADRWHTAAEFADALAGKTLIHATASEALPSQPQTPVPHGPSNTLLKAALVAACVVAVAAGAIALRATHATPSDRTGVMRFSVAIQSAPLGTGFPTIAISPNGRTVVYVSGGDAGHLQLFARAIGDVHPRMLAGTETGLTPFFSPDGKQVGFSVPGSPAALKTVAVDGGSPVAIAEVAGTVFGATWLPSGQVIVCVPGGFAVVPATGGTPRYLANRDSLGASPRWPLALDANTVLFTSWRGSVGTVRIAKLSVQTGKIAVFDLPGTTPLGIIDGHLIYVGTNGSLMAVPFDMKRLEPAGAPISMSDQAGVGPLGEANASLSLNGSLVYVSGSASSQLAVVDGHGEGKTMLATPRPYSYPRYSPDGKRVAMTIEAAGRADIWVYNVGDATLSRITTAGNANDRPEWSPDGKRVLYRSDRGGRSALWWQPADGSGTESPLLQIPNVDVFEGVLSPDQHTIVYRTGTTGEADIWYRRFDGDTAPKPIANTPFLEWNARLSADGLWVAYASQESGRYQVYVRPFPGPGARYQVSTDGGQWPVWSRDGRRLFYVTGQQLLAAVLSYSPTLGVTSREHVLDGDFSTSSPGHAGFDVSPDGHVLLLKPVAGDAQTVIAIHWDDELRGVLSSAAKR